MSKCQIRSTRSGRKGKRGVPGQNLVSNSMLLVTAGAMTVPILDLVKNINCQSTVNITDENPMDLVK